MFTPTRLLFVHNCSFVYVEKILPIGDYGYIYLLDCK